MTILTLLLQMQNISIIRTDCVVKEKPCELSLFGCFYPGQNKERITSMNCLVISEASLE